MDCSSANQEVWTEAQRDKPTAPGLTALAQGSILRSYALAIAIARLTDNPAAHAARVIAVSDAEGEARVHEALRPWPSALRRQVYTHLQHLRAAEPVLTGWSRNVTPRVVSGSVSQITLGPVS